MSVAIVCHRLPTPHWCWKPAAAWRAIETAFGLFLSTCRKTIASAISGLFGLRNSVPIFDTIHKCRNFDDVLIWAKEHQEQDGLVAEVRGDDVILDIYP
jgi:hypothetical protein